MFLNCGRKLWEFQEENHMQSMQTPHKKTHSRLCVIPSVLLGQVLINLFINRRLGLQCTFSSDEWAPDLKSTTATPHSSTSTLNSLQFAKDLVSRPPQHSQRMNSVDDILEWYGVLVWNTEPMVAVHMDEK